MRACVTSPRQVLNETLTPPSPALPFRDAISLPEFGEVGMMIL
jgi:hypothetical protein